MDQPKRNELYNQLQKRMDQVYLAPFPTLSKYQVWQPWLHEFYASLLQSLAVQLQRMVGGGGEVAGGPHGLAIGYGRD